MNNDEMTKAIMEVFKNNQCNVGDMLSFFDFKKNLSSADAELFDIVSHDLESKNYFGIEGNIDKLQYRLKQAGYDYILQTFS